MAACALLLALFTVHASAQDRYQTSGQQTASSTVSSMRYTPPGYYPDPNMAWVPAGYSPQPPTLRPYAPGYKPGPDGELEFYTPPGFRPACSWWGCGSVGNWLKCHHQEKQSFCSYIRGYGPAIHTRQASYCW